VDTEEVTTSESQVKKRSDSKVDFYLRHLTGHRKGLVERFDADRMSIGRGKNNHCSFDAEKERSVSHRHCEIRIEGGTPTVYDIGSLNGTYVNGRRVRRSPLTDGDEIGLGREGPRLQFGIGTGDSVPSGSPPPAADQIPDRLHHIGATAEERQPLSLPSPRSFERRRRKKIVFTAALALAILAGATWPIAGLLKRIELLENRTGAEATETPSSLEPAGPAPLRAHVRAPAAIPSGPRGSVTRLLGIVRDDRGRIVDQETLGFGAIVRTDGVVTTRDVHQRLKIWLGRAAIDQRHDKILLAAPNGAIPGAPQVEACVLHPQGKDEEDGNLVLLLLEEGTRMPRAATAPPRPGVMRFYAPWEAPQDLEIRQLTNTSNSTVRPTEATVIRFETGPQDPPPPAGMPLFAGDELIGISLGRDVAGRAISSVAILRLLRHAETASAELITSEEK